MNKYSLKSFSLSRSSLLSLLLLVAMVPWADARNDPEKTSVSETNSLATPEILSASDTGELRLTLQESILTGLENNPEIMVERLNPAIRQTQEDQERAQFDPTLSSSFYYQKTSSPGAAKKNQSEQFSGGVSVDTFLPTGTTIGISEENSGSDPGGSLGTDTSSRLGVNVNQSLLRGAGTGVNLASLRQAKLDTLSSEYELRGYAESLVSSIEKAYWNYYVSQLSLQIYKDSLDLAQKQLDETRERINVGKLSESELAAAKAEVALRNEELINARSTEDTNRLKMLRLLTPRKGNYWNMQVFLRDVPSPPVQALDSVETLVQAGLQKRPDLRQAQLQLQRGELDVVKSKNGLLPKLDLFVNLGGTGYSRTFTDTFGNLNGDYYDLQAGFSFEYPLFNRSAKAKHRAAQLGRDQYELSLVNMEQLVQEDIRTAYIEVNRTIQQIDATKATRLSQEESLRSETEKFRVGKSTSLLVAQAQRDYLSSQIEEVQALTNYVLALVDLYRLNGSLLERYGLSAQYVENK